MKFLTLTACLVIVFAANAQVIDTLVNVGKYKLHFTIIPGKGIPILFEAGGAMMAPFGITLPNLLPQ